MPIREQNLRIYLLSAAGGVDGTSEEEGWSSSGPSDSRRNQPAHYASPTTGRRLGGGCEGGVGVPRPDQVWLRIRLGAYPFHPTSRPAKCHGWDTLRMQDELLEQPLPLSTTEDSLFGALRLLPRDVHERRGI